jgi:hypothetical protein
LRSDTSAYLDEYKRLFEGATRESAIGEASVAYFNSPATAGRINSVLPDVQILLVLRNPIERAYSHYNMLVIHGAAPPPPYVDVLHRAMKTGDYENTGIPTSRYANSLEEYQFIFGSRLNILFYEDFQCDAADFLRRVYTAVGVDPDFQPNIDDKYNTSHRPRSKQLSKLSVHNSSIKSGLRRLLPRPVRSAIRLLINQYNQKPVPPLDDDSRKIIYDLLRQDIDKTEALLKHELSGWRL